MQNFYQKLTPKLTSKLTSKLTIKLTNAQKLSYLPILLLLIFLLVSALLKQQYEFNFFKQEDLYKWNLVQGEAPKVTQGNKALNIEVDKKNPPVFLLDNSLNNQKLLESDWQDYRFAKIELASAAANKPLTLSILWLYKPDNYRLYTIEIPAGKTKAIIDLTQSKVWERKIGFPAQYPITSIGLILNDDIALSKLTIASSLSIFDNIKYIFHSITQYSPIMVSSINFYYYRIIYGEYVNLILGLLAAYYVILLFMFKSSSSSKFNFSALIVLLISNELSYLLAMQDYSNKAFAKSQIYDDRYQQLQSRFSTELADLDAKLYELIPIGSKVLFPFPNYYKYYLETEINWLWLHYYGEFENKFDRGRGAGLSADFEYIFYYHAKNLKITGTTITDTRAKIPANAVKSLNIQEIYTVSDNVKLLKILL